MPPPPPTELLAGFPVIVETPVAWADMDYFRHVNNTVFFRYFESARIAYLERIGFDDEERHAGVGPILHSTHARFRRPVVYPDTVRAGARAVELSEDRFAMEYRVTSERLGAIVAEGGGVVVSYDYRAGRKAPLPAGVREGILRLDGAVEGR
jgi:acyl-CoA thioester hydrolase